MRRTILFSAGSAAVIALLAVAGTLVFPEPATRRAIVVSAVVALAVQAAAFGILWRARTSPLIGWGLGSLLRFGALGVYAAAGVRGAGLEAAPALISLAAFLFATMILEPLALQTK